MSIGADRHGFIVNHLLSLKGPCRAATTANITLSGAQTIDGVAVIDNDRVLVKNQSIAKENAIYLAKAGAWELVADFDQRGHVVKGTRVLVTDGTTNALTEWYVSTEGRPVPGRSDISFAKVIDSDLAAIAALTPADGNIIVGDGTTWVTESGATARTSLGLGTGDSPQFTGIELGHASDTTLTRSGAGDMAIEGNGVYRASGTDVPVGDGGTGRSSHTAYAVVCGGTDTTTAQQSIAGVGSSGQVLTSNGAGALPTFQAAGASGGTPTLPQGRITLTSGTPVMVATVSGATTVYYTPYIGLSVPLYNGTSFSMTSTGGELSQATTDTTKSPAAVAASSNYDVFVWSDSGTIRATRGPAWSSDTARGTGAGTTELVRVDGIWLNAVAITNGPAAQRGTYVGTIRSNASSTIDWILGALGVGGTAAVLGVWNAYHRVSVETFVQDSTNSWTYTTATWRSANASAAMRVSAVFGLAEDSFGAEHLAYSSNTLDAALAARACGIGYDATNALASGCSPGRAHIADMVAAAAGTGQTILNPISEMTARFNKIADLGLHFCQAIEISAAVGVTTWYGDNGEPTTFTQNGLFFRGRF